MDKNIVHSKWEKFDKPKTKPNKKTFYKNYLEQRNAYKIKAKMEENIGK